MKGLSIAICFLAFTSVVNGWTWTVDTVDTADAGRFSSIAVDPSGHPQISYFNNADEDLMCARWNGSEWAIDTVDSDGDVGVYTSIAVDNDGYPRISYWDRDNYDLKYARWTGSEWVIETVDSEGDQGSHSSIAIDGQNHSHISYLEGDGNDLKYTYWDGEYWQFEYADNPPGTTPSLGHFSSLALDSNDDPHIAYFHYTSENLSYAKKAEGVWQVETVEYSGDVGDYCSISLDSHGNPHISYRSYTNKTVRYAHRDGSWSCETVDSLPPTGVERTSIEVDPYDVVHISYFDWTNGDLKYARKVEESWLIEKIDSIGSVGWDNSLALDAYGRPHICYHNLWDGDLKHAAGMFSKDASSISVDNPGSIVFVDSTYLPKATVMNTGLDSIELDVSCIIDTSGLPVYGDTIHIPALLSNQSTQVTFAGWTVGSEDGISYRVVVHTSLTDDENLSNDNLSLTALSVRREVHVAAGSDTSGMAGDSITVGFLISNTGGVTDSYDLSRSDSLDWELDLSVLSVTLGSGEDSLVPLSVIIPPGTPPQDTNWVELTATSQADPGISDSGRLTITVEEPIPSFIRADADANSTITMSDAIYILKYLYVPGAPDPTCMKTADTDDDGTVVMSDAVYTLKYIYVPGAPDPAPPFPDCGIDPTSDALGCGAHPCMGR